MLDAAGRFRWANAAFTELVGRLCEQLVGMAFEEITHPEDVDAEQEAFAALVRGGRDTYVTEQRYVRPDAGQV